MKKQVISIAVVIILGGQNLVYACSKYDWNSRNYRYECLVSKEELLLEKTYELLKRQLEIMQKPYKMITSFFPSHKKWQ